MYKHKFLGKASVLPSYAFSLAKKLAGSKNIEVYTYRTYADEVKYFDSALDFEYDTLLVFWKRFADSKHSYDEVQIWDDVGRLAVLNRKEYKEMVRGN